MLSFGPTLAIIFASRTYIIRILEILLDTGKGIKAVLDEYYYSSTVCLDKKDGNPVVSIVDARVLETVEKAVRISVTLKLALTHLLSHWEDSSFVVLSGSESQTPTTSLEAPATTVSSLLRTLIHEIVAPVLMCKTTSADSLSVCGVTLAQLLLVRWKLTYHTSAEGIADSARHFFFAVCAQNTAVLTHPSEQVLRDHSDSSEDMEHYYFDKLPNLNALAIARGMAATLDHGVLLQQSLVGFDVEPSASLLIDIASFILRLARTSTDNSIRLSSLKGLDTILCVAIHALHNTNCLSLEASSVLSESRSHGMVAVSVFLHEIRNLSNDILQICLVAWESPVCRRVGQAVPPLFRRLLEVIQIVDERSSHILNGESTTEKTLENTFQHLVLYILGLPANRKVSTFMLLR